MHEAKINCPACDQPIEIPATMRGQFLKCPACEQGFRIPGKPPRELPVKLLAVLALIIVVGLPFVWMLISSDDGREFGLTILVVACGIAFYFAPALVAHQRNHHQQEAIFMLNLLAGWTLIGWIIAAVWAHVKKT